MTIQKEHIKVDGYRGRWYVIDQIITGKGKFYLLEHEVYGDETCALVVDANFNFIAETYDDLFTALEDEGII